MRIADTANTVTLDTARITDQSRKACITYIETSIADSNTVLVIQNASDFTPSVTNESFNPFIMNLDNALTEISLKVSDY